MPRKKRNFQLEDDKCVKSNKKAIFRKEKRKKKGNKGVTGRKKKVSLEIYKQIGK